MESHQFKKGQEVGFIDEVGKGEVLEVLSDGTLKILTEDGFDNIYPVSKLVPRYDLMEPEEKKEKKIEGPVLEMKGLRLGTEVSLRGREEKAVIIAIKRDGTVELEMEDLFTEKHHIDDLVTWDSINKKDLEKSFEDVSLEEIGEGVRAQSGERTVQDRRESGTWEVDLHIQELVDNSYGMQTHEVVQLQLDHFTTKLENAVDRGLKKVIFIHGRGNGRLRDAIRQILTRYPHCEFMDGDYKRYGVGATEVRIKYRPQQEED